MAEEKTITPDAPSASEEITPVDPVVFVDDPDTQDIPVVTEPAEDPTEEDRFDKNPKFQDRLKSMQDREKKADDLIKNVNQMIAQARNEDRRAYESQIAELRNELKGLSTKREPEKLDFWRAEELDRDAFTQRWEDDPLGVYGNMARQLRHELSSINKPMDEKALAEKITNNVIQLLMRESQNASVKSGISKFVEDNPDFMEMKEQVQALRRKEPWHNEISAYYQLKQADLDKEVEKRVAERLKKETTDAMENGKTVKPMTNKPRAPAKPRDIPDDVVNPNKYNKTVTQAIHDQIKNLRKRGGPK